MGHRDFWWHQRHRQPGQRDDDQASETDIFPLLGVYSIAIC